MTQDIPDRRAQARERRKDEVEVLVDGGNFPGVLINLSTGGVQIGLDPLVFDEIRERIEAVRLPGCPPLKVELRWGFFDGRFGASFREPQAAESVVSAFLSAKLAS